MVAAAVSANPSQRPNYLFLGKNREIPRNQAQLHESHYCVGERNQLVADGIPEVTEQGIFSVEQGIGFVQTGKGRHSLAVGIKRLSLPFMAALRWAMLSAMSDYEVHDIGLTRGHILNVAVSSSRPLRCVASF
jgi:hypothetical protein